ncbi:MAG TPA: peptidase MA family metallohydrolase [Longimicrobiales bacterium]|nr:peptidase MA family metallohydrolase [Longimicrobiales bacterium]
MISAAAPALALALALQGVVTAGPVRIHFWPPQEALAIRTAERLEGTLEFPGLPSGALGPDGVDVWLAPTPAHWDSLTGGAVPEWGAGVADPEQGLIVLPTYDWARTPPHALQTTLRHELAHVALQRWLGPARMPRWFTEGYAQWTAGEWTFESAWRLRLALFSDRTPPLDSLTLDWPAAEADARVAYLLSASAVAYLVDRSGERGLTVLLRRWRETTDFDRAFRATYGLTMGQFEEDWRAWVKKRFGWTVLLGQSAVFWGIVAVLLVVLFAIRRRRDRDRMARLRATEPPDDPAYWEPPFDEEPNG